MAPVNRVRACPCSTCSPMQRAITRNAEKSALYDLARDPRERISLAHSSPEETAHARRILDDHRKKALELRAALELTREETIELDAETWERLRSLGYVQ